MNSVYQKEAVKKRGSSIERAIAVLTMIAIMVSVAFGMAGEPAYAADSVSIKSEKSYAKQGDGEATIFFQVENRGADSVTVDFIFGESGGIRIVGGSSGLVVQGGNFSNPGVVEGFVKLDVDKLASSGLHTIDIIIHKTGDKNVIYGEGSIRLDVAERQTGGKGAAVDTEYQLSNPQGIIAGSDNTLSLAIFNRGNTTIKNAQISLVLPDGMSINNAAGYINAGYISIGDTYKCKFPITADESMTTKNYAVTVKIVGSDSSNEAVALEQTLYIPVKGTGATVSAKDIEITNISIPQQVLAGDDFTLVFDVANKGTGKLADTKVTVEVPEGLANKTKNVFVVTGLAAGSSQKCSVTMFGTDKTKDNEYKLVKITAESTSGDKTASVSQYAGTMVKSVGGNAKTPQLMVSNYTYGGSYVQAGDSFSLNLGLYNTSATQDLVNVKVTVSSEDGTFIPVKSSNSFYIDKITAKGTDMRSINLSTKQDAEQKTTSLSIDMSYEDTAGNAFTSKDVISVPVMQETRLVVDDVVAPPELYAGMQSGLSVAFYNMGKTVLNNLRVNVEGDFDAPQSNMYYVGNMEKGKSDSYDFAFIPRQSGPMAGTITFTYEDAAGVEQRYEKSFEVTVMEDIPMVDPGMMEPEPEETKIPWIPIAAVCVPVAVIIGIVLWRKHRKKKLDQEMEIDE